VPRKSKNLKHNENKDIKGIIFVTVGVLMLLSVFSSSSGILGKLVKKILVSVLGLGAYIFPFIVIFIGTCYIIKKKCINFNVKFYGIILFILNTLLFIQMLIIDSYYINGNIIEGIVKLYNADNVFHGGIISYLIDIPLYKLLGKIGSYVIFISVYIVSFVLICKLSLYDLINNIRKQIPKMKENLNDISEEISSNEVALDEKKEDTSSKNIKNRIKIIDFMKSSKIEPKESKKISEPVIASYSNNSDKDINEELEKEINKNTNNSVDVEYKFPSSDLLNMNNQLQFNKEDKKELLHSANKLEDALASFGVDAKVIQVTKGPSVTRFELQPSAGVKVSKIVNLSDDIALNLAASGVRIEAPIPGKSAIGIEVPNKKLTAVYLREVIESEEFFNSNKDIAFSLGKDIAGKCVVADLAKMPHLLIAGATGSGKSVCINTLIISILYKYSPNNVKLLMIDPKVVELSVYNGIPHLLIPVVTNPKKAAGALNWAVNEMTKRYSLFAKNNVRNIEGYNELAAKGIVENKLPWIVIIIDELADLMMVCPNDVEDYIGRLAQMARAAGMHLVIATQRPSVDVITGVIKANIPSRISFAVSSQVDSRTILDMSGAEKLLGKGDMLFYPVGESKPIRIQGAFISEEEVEKVVNFIKEEKGEVEYVDEIMEEIDTSVNKKELDYDELLDEAVKIVVDMDQASTSLLQRKLKIGYNRAARIMDQMEEMSIISGRDGSKPRKVLIDKECAIDKKYYPGNNL
jgi:S-DNA-T family DNA segregation ATPase FtsK/SpoIIIE